MSYGDGELGRDGIVRGTGTITGTSADEKFWATGTITTGAGSDLVWAAGNIANTISGEAGNDQLMGGSVKDTIRGGTLADSISGVGGNDKLYGDDGNDRIWGGTGRDSIFGGDGNDFLKSCGLIDWRTRFRSKPVEIGKDDPFYSRFAEDWWVADTYADELFGGEGNDIIYGSGGDKLSGGTGNDALSFIHNAKYTQSAVLDGGTGIDNVAIDASSLTQNILFRANAAGTFSFAPFGLSVVSCEIVSMTTGSGNDTLYGGNAGGESFFAGDGDNILDGRAGNDTLIAGAGLDEAFGSAGDDRIRLGAGNDFLFGGEGNDELNGGAGNDTAKGEEGADTIYGFEGNDLIDGGTESDKLYGGLDNDKIYGGSGNDTLRGGTESSLSAGMDGDDRLEGGIGNDTLIADDNFESPLLGGNDYLAGGAGNDGLYGRAGNDTLVGGTGDDAIFGSYGFDTVYYSKAAGRVVVNLKMGIATGADGKDKLSGINGIIGSIYNDILTGDDNLTLYNLIRGGRGNDTIEGLEGEDRLHGDSGNDLMRGGAGVDQLYGGSGTDSLFGGTGNDTLNGGDAADIILGGAGDDSILDSRLRSGTGDTIGDNLIFGNDGDDSIDVSTATDSNIVIGGVGKDEITGGAGIDRLFASYFKNPTTTKELVDRASLNIQNYVSNESDSDVLNGGIGNDIIYGGIGDVIRGGSGEDDITLAIATIDFQIVGASIDGGSEHDQAFVSFFNGSPSVNFETEITMNVGTDTDGFEALFVTVPNMLEFRIKNIEDLQFTAGSAADDLSGFLGAKNRISGSGGHDKITGGGLEDSLFGDSGDDSLFGGSGDDKLVGGSGFDLLAGLAGHDTLTGGADGDLFRFTRLTSSTPFGHDMIMDFNPTEDKIRVWHTAASSFADILDLTLNVTGGIMIAFDSQNTINLQGLTRTSLSAANFEFAI